MNLIQAQEKFIMSLLDSVTEPWDKIEVHYENYSWDNQKSEMYVANRFLNGDKFDIDLNFETFEELNNLQQIVPQGQTEPWTWLLFNIDSAGKYNFEYKYGVPPFIFVEIAANQ